MHSHRQQWADMIWACGLGDIRCMLERRIVRVDGLGRQDSLIGCTGTADLRANTFRARGLENATGRQLRHECTTEGILATFVK